MSVTNATVRINNGDIVLSWDAEGCDVKIILQA